MKLITYMLTCIGAPLGIVVFLVARPIRSVLRDCVGEKGFGGITQIPELFCECGIITLFFVLVIIF